MWFCLFIVDACGRSCSAYVLAHTPSHTRARAHNHNVNLQIQQLVASLAFIRKPGVEIIHCDLKPENVLLCEPFAQVGSQYPT